jgi:hypothetical protein
MDGVRAGTPGDFKNEVAAEVGLGGGSRPEAIRLVGVEDMQCGAIRIGVHGNAADAKLAACTQNAKRDLSSIGNQNFTNRSQEGALWN